ncbi:cupredoxin domain-containing protein [Virgibacillus profundi]|uniref:cupredoxin domain-containing protein n=1 Tax=Virgibacillus profundi TaxID=2024555 RepID=UPI0013FD1652|nr:cupredoxin domain-containing protein [Virgibacillus profundi]
MKKSLLAVLFFSLILFLAACGGDSSDASTDTADTDESATEEQSEDTEAASDQEASNEVNVVATNFDLGQDEFVVKAGEEVTLTLTNEEGNHGISIDEFDVNLQSEGEVTFIPEEPGEYTIYCNIFCGDGHGDMTSTLVVI